MSQSQKPPLKSLGLEERFSVEYIQAEASAIMRCVVKPSTETENAKLASLRIEPTNEDELKALKYIRNYHKGKSMDKQINKVKKDVEKGDKKKAEKDIGKLLKMDKKFDAKLDKCDEEMKTPKKRKS